MLTQLLSVTAVLLIAVCTTQCLADIDIVEGKPKKITLYDVLPRNESAVTSMVTIDDNTIVGVASGRTAAHVFRIDSTTNKIEKLVTIKKGAKYWSHPTIASHGSNILVAFAFEPYVLHEWAKAKSLTKAKSVVANDELVSPPIYILDLKTKTLKEYPSPIAGSGTTGLTVNAHSGIFYALTVPPLFADGSHLFSINPATGEGKDFGVVSKSPKFYDHQIPCNAVAFDEQGSVLLTGNGILKKYDIKQKTLKELSAKLPAVPGRHDFSYIEALVDGPDGDYYGGTSDGYLFRLDPEECQIENFGKALRQMHVIDLVRDGYTLYGVGGEKNGLPRLFSFDTKSRTFTLGGTPQAKPREAFGQIGALSFANGKLYVAENERNACIFIYSPEADE